MKRQYKQAALAICSSHRVVIAGHVNPDGDTLGCCLALYHALTALGKDVVALSADGVPDIYRWMPGAEHVQRFTERRDFDLAIVCDAGTLDRIGSSLVPVVESAPVIIDVDHHVADGVFGQIQVLDSGAAATAELVWLLLRELNAACGSDLVSYETAVCLMTGLITDTGSFRFLNVTPRTFMLAARLQRLGALPAPIAELVFENRSYGGLRLLGRALDRLRTTDDGLVAWSTIRASDFSEFSAADDETEGIVNHVRSVRGAMVGVLFREVPGKKVRISLRGRDGADVNRIAQVFGGGGHKLAAGCSVEPPLDSVVEAVVAEARRQLAQSA